VSTWGAPAAIGPFTFVMTVAGRTTAAPNSCRAASTNGSWWSNDIVSSSTACPSSAQFDRNQGDASSPIISP